MVSRDKFIEVQKRAFEMLEKNKIVLTDIEKENIEVADFGLGDIERTGLQIVTYVNTDRVCAKELIMFAHQTCPEHRHPAVNGSPGKEETFRCQAGVVYLYVPGEPTVSPSCTVPTGQEQYYTVWHEIILRPGDQYTLMPNTLHWFQAGAEGAIVSEFSTKSTDEADIFTNPNIVREPAIECIGSDLTV